VYYANITSFDVLPAFIVELAKDKKHFVLALKRFLFVESFCSVNEYLNYQREIKIDGSSIRKAVQFKHCLFFVACFVDLF
jgi:hypothetical protein